VIGDRKRSGWLMAETKNRQYCRDCRVTFRLSPNSPKKSGAVGNRSLQPRYSFRVFPAGVQVVLSPSGGGRGRPLVSHLPYGTVATVPYYELQATSCCLSPLASSPGAFFAIHYPLFTIHHPPSTIHYSPSTIPQALTYEHH
jgi:hypothetical protein